MLVSTTYGAIAGYVGGWIDGLMLRLVDVLLAIPFMFVLILLLVMFGKSLGVLLLGSGLLSWSSMARIVRCLTPK